MGIGLGIFHVSVGQDGGIAWKNQSKKRGSGEENCPAFWLVFAGWIFLSVLNVRTSVQLNLPCSKVQGYECGDFNMK